MIQDNLRLVCRTFPDRDREYVRLLASRLSASVPRTVALFVSGEAEPARIFLARSRDMNLHCGDFLRGALAEHGLRGGGSPDLAQGDLPRDQAEQISVKLAATLRSLLARPRPAE
jgi:alanyl-tRNA synthetase